MRKKFFITALLATMMFAACDTTGKVTDPTKGPIEAKFTTNIIAPVSTRVSYGQFQINDEMGIFMKSAGSTLEYGTALSENVLARLTRAGAAQTLEMTPSIIYPENGNVDFIAYYPYSNNPVQVQRVVEGMEGEEISYSEEALYALPVDANDQSEVLYSNNAKNLAPSETAVPLNFKYSMAKIKVTVTAAAGSETLTAEHFSNMTATVNNVNTFGYLNLATGSFLDNDGFVMTSNEMYLHRPTSYSQPATSATFEALVLPTASCEHVFTFNINGNNYRVPLTRSYEAGIEYTLPFQLNIGTPPTVVYLAAQATITPRTPDTTTPTTTVTDEHIDN